MKSSIREAIVDLGLKDGMTISFHHAFRGGDKTVNLVMEVIAELGIKNLTLASSSLTSCHSPLIEHIKNGVVSKIYTSGIRGALADSISNGLLDEPVHIHSHGGRVHLIQSGELYIDMALLAYLVAMNLVTLTVLKASPIVAHSAMPKLMPSTLKKW